jgi:hypothetical protein
VHPLVNPFGIDTKQIGTRSGNGSRSDVSMDYRGGKAVSWEGDCEWNRVD